jgi:protein gp37
MAEKSRIEWTESTWNPVTGCTKISEGCENCYAQKMAKRLCAMGQKKYKNEFKLTLHPDCLNEPLKWKKPQVIFVCSMSDLFHKDVPDDFIMQVFDIMNQAHWHTFQVLTKRSERLNEIAFKLNWTPNIWLGVTVESDKRKCRIEDLVKTPAQVKYLSVEPMLEEIRQIPLEGVDWVIVGGESGFGARPIKEEWILPIKDKCLEMEIPFFFKQWGGVNKKANGCELQGRYWKEMPEFNTTQLAFG